MADPQSNDDSEAEKRRLELFHNFRKEAEKYRRGAPILFMQRIKRYWEAEKHRRELEDPPLLRVVTEQEAEKHRKEAEKRDPQVISLLAEGRRRHRKLQDEIRKAAPRSALQRVVTEQDLQECYWSRGRAFWICFGLLMICVGYASGAPIPPLQRVLTEQTDRQWTNEERLKMEKSSLLIEHNSLLSEFKKKCSNLEKTQEELKNTKLELEQVMETNQTKLERLEKELQDKNSQIQDMMIRQLQEKDKQLQEKDKQLQEKDKQLQEKLQERTDPDPSVPIRRRKSIDTPPFMSGESSDDL